MQLRCLLKISLEIQKPGFPRGLSRGCAFEVYPGVAMLCAVPAADVHCLFQDGCNDPTLI